MTVDIDVFELSVNGVRSVLRSCGPASAREAVLFVHGNPGSGADFCDLLQRVGEFARAVAPDMPGYGKADRPADFDYSVAGFAQHLAGLIEQLGLERVHLVLHDFGGPWGMAWASQHLASLASLTLINIGLLPGYRWHKYARIWRTPLLGELSLATTPRFLWRFLLDAENPKPLPRAMLDRMFDDFDAGAKRGLLRLYRGADVAQLSRELAVSLADLRAPVAVMWGARDSYLPATYAERQREFFRNIEVHILDGSGHWPFIDDPERFAALFIPFLRRNLDGRQGSPEAC
jgi:pimeloyl-ACP methyl ester carboxylesterase